MDQEVASTSTQSLPLPSDFIYFLKENGLDPSIYVSLDSIPRYIRLKPGLEACIEEIKADIKCDFQTVSWLPSFYSLPHDVRVASSQSYQQGKIYGIDAASGAAVSALGISSGDHILDLCAAPGAKLCMMLDLLGNSGSATGVDIAKHRLAACRTLLQKYGLGDRCRLFVGDGTKFSIIPVRVHKDLRSGQSEVYKEWTSKKTWKERKSAKRVVGDDDSNRLPGSGAPELIYYGQNSGVLGLSKNELYRVDTSSELSVYGYDKVLVDAECTHDGSVRHIQKYEHWGWDTLTRRVLDAERSDGLTNLQLQLLTNGFRLLKVGGFLVYSTCSLTISQNENVVEQFMLQNASAELVEIDGAEKWPCKSGRIHKTLRFDPLVSGTSGLFVAKFTKVAL